jgi:hypothetical protein
VATFAFSVTKSITWRGVDEFFSNVYHYDVGTNTLQGDLQNVLDAVVTNDKKAHAGSVAYRSARCWGPTGQGQAASVTRIIQDLSGFGTMAGVGGDIYKEATVVVQWYMGRIGAGGRKVWLRKFFHCMKLPANGSGSLGDASIGSSNKAPFVTAGNDMKNISVPFGSATLSRANGTGLPVGTNAEVLDHLHVRQFKQ